ncbi:glycosyltransferase family 87 protein [Cryobacterium sp. SO2]|uniref:glycosyltransferase family 87 protein n=1 Tax=Cryobacterium sp. SO2 TaxID=1897060 RepID=UPI00223D0907|nr:glycosyltransferase family 87 protein [Cryobacterium sp. SO2]WEO78164.1 glycosyltransferase family 87 protein [Cryobacterium sp. SO2]
MRIAIVSALLVISAAVTAGLVVAFDLFRPHRDTVPLLVGTLVLWLLFAAAVLALRKVRGKAVVVLVLAGSVVLGGAAMAGPPNTSTDSARYAWDGIVQNAGISPYAYTPADDRLDGLRPDWLFPAPVAVDADGGVKCVGERIETVDRGETLPLCSALNRTRVPTIYPPAAEIYFAAVRAVVGAEAGYWPLQLTGLLLSVGITGMLLVGMRRRGIDQRYAALWAWCPLVATEGITNSHVDLLGVAFVLAAVFWVSSARYVRGGILLGMAIGVKLIPAIAAPAMLRRQGWKVVVAAALTFLLLYVPYVLATGIGVLGYLPGYLTEEGYEDGSRFALVSLIAPGSSAIVVAAILLAGLAAFTIWKTDPDRPWLGQLVMIGGTLLVLSPRYPWYALLLLPFIALSGRWEWLAIPLALTVRLLVPSLTVTRVSLAVALLIIVVVSVRRAGPGAWGRWRAALPGVKTGPQGDQRS